MKRTLVGAFAVSLCACGSVKKSQPDASEVHADVAIDAFDCSQFPLAGTFTRTPNAVKANTQVTFTAKDIGAHYAWTFGSGTPATSTDASPTVTWSALGDYAVTLAVSDPQAPCTSNSMQNLTVCTSAAPLVGATGGTVTSGWNNYGIAITANKDTTLTNFTVMGKGNADTLQLTDSAGTVLQTLAMPAGSPTYQASVDWPLAANQSYHLLSTSGDNLSYVAGTFPYNGTSISIVSGWGLGGEQASYYFGFSNLVTCP